MTIVVNNSVNSHSMQDSSYTESAHVLLYTFGRFILTGLGMLVCLSTFWLNYRLVGAIDSVEYSLTEILQEFLLAVDAALFVLIARKNTKLKEVAVLAGCFTLCMLVRELDFFFDSIAVHLWKIIVVCIVIFAFHKTLRLAGWRRTLNSMKEIIFSDGFGAIFYGMLMVLILSRVMGMNQLWAFTGAERSEYYIYKRFVEESLELCGYYIYSSGVFSLFLNTLKQDNRA